MRIKEKKIPETKVAYITYMGSYDNIPGLVQELGDWIMEKDLEMTGMVYGTYFNSPEDVPEDDLKFEIGFSIAGDAEPEGNVKIKEIPEHIVLSAHRKGPYNEVGRTIHAISEYSVKNNYELMEPVSEVYLNDPTQVPERKLRTEVRIPVFIMTELLDS